MHLNSMAGIEKVRESGITSKQKMAVVMALLQKSPQTRNELSASTGILVTSLCGRLNELKKAGIIYAPCSKRGYYRIPNEAYALTEEAYKALTVVWEA